jgi:ATP-dependent Clp protease protease subunit
VDPDRRADLASAVERALFDRRVILVSGTVDNERAGTVAAALMTLDATGDDPVELRLNADSDSLDVALALMDTIDVLGVTVNATVAGTVGGTMVGVLAVCQRRRIGALGSVFLREPRHEYEGAAADIARRASELATRFDQYLRRLAEATSRPLEHLEADLQAGLRLDAPSALGYGVVDEILAHPPPGVRTS